MSQCVCGFSVSAQILTGSSRLANRSAWCDYDTSDLVSQSYGWDAGQCQVLECRGSSVCVFVSEEYSVLSLTERCGIHDPPRGTENHQRDKGQTPMTQSIMNDLLLSNSISFSLFHTVPLKTIEFGLINVVRGRWIRMHKKYGHTDNKIIDDNDMPITIFML